MISWRQDWEHWAAEGEVAREDGAVAASYAGGPQVHSHVKLPEGVDAQDGAHHVSGDEVEVELV